MKFLRNFLNKNNKILVGKQVKIIKIMIIIKKTFFKRIKNKIIIKTQFYKKKNWKCNIRILKLKM